MTRDILQIDIKSDGICRLTLTDTARRNALSIQMLSELSAAIEAANAETSVRVIIIAAEGPAFSAGHDLKEIRAARAAEDAGRSLFETMMTKCSDLMQLIVNCPKPVIAEIAGVATAAGCQLVASCDLAVASEEARFATPGVNIGLFCSTPMVALSRNVTNKQAMEMLLTGEMIGAEKALSFGLINKVVPRDQLRASTEAIARTIAAKPAKILAIGKRAFYTQREMDLSDAYAYTSKVMVENMLNAQAKEGIGAFLDKRHPDWDKD